LTSNIHKALKRGRQDEAEDTARRFQTSDVETPVCRRYFVNDATVEKLGELR
jgi:hypothetical protein